LLWGTCGGEQKEFVGQGNSAAGTNILSKEGMLTGTQTKKVTVPGKAGEFDGN
jgi:hypothetical protein